MKKINSLFLVFTMLSLLVFNSCSSDSDDEDNPPTDETTIIQNSIKGKFFNLEDMAYNFIDNENVEVWSNIIIDKGEYYYQYKKLIYKVYTEKSYIGIKDISKSLPYIYENKELYIYDNKQNKTKGITKPDYYKPESKQPNNPEQPEIKIDTIYFNTSAQLLHFSPNVPLHGSSIISSVSSNMDILFYDPNISIRLKGVLMMPNEYTKTYKPSIYNFYGTVLNTTYQPIIIQYKDGNKQFSDTIQQPNYAWWQYTLTNNKSVMYLDFKGKHAYYRGNFSLGSLTLMTWTKAIDFLNDGIDFSSKDLKYTNVQLSEKKNLTVIVPVNPSETNKSEHVYTKNAVLKIEFNDNLSLSITSKSIPYETDEDLLTMLKNRGNKDNISISFNYNSDTNNPSGEKNFSRNIIKREWDIDNEKLTLTFHYNTYKSTIIIPLSDIEIADI